MDFRVKLNQNYHIPSIPISAIQVLDSHCHGRRQAHKYLKIMEILILHPPHPRYPNENYHRPSIPFSTIQVLASHCHRAHRSQNQEYHNSAVTRDSTVKLNENYQRPSIPFSAIQVQASHCHRQTGFRRSDLKIMDILILQSP